MYSFTCSAVIRDRRETAVVQAVSEKQAWFKFCSKYSYQNRDFKIIRQVPVQQQLSFI